MFANHGSHSWVGVGTTNQSGYLKYWSNSWDNRYKGGTTLVLGHRNGLAVIPRLLLGIEMVHLEGR